MLSGDFRLQVPCLRPPGAPTSPATRSPGLGSAPDQQAVTEMLPELGDGEDQLARLLDVIGHPAPLHRGAIEDHIAGARIGVARLADAADIDDGLARVDLPTVIQALEAVPGEIVAGDHPGTVGMADEAGMLDE